MGDYVHYVMIIVNHLLPKGLHNNIYNMIAFPLLQTPFRNNYRTIHGQKTYVPPYNVPKKLGEGHE